MKIERRIQSFLIKRKLLWLYRGVKACHEYDDSAKKYFDMIGDCTIRIRVMPDVAGIVIRQKNGELYLVQEDELLVGADLDVCFKNLAAAQGVLRGRVSIKQGYAERRFVVRGDISSMMLLNNIVSIAMTYILADPAARKAYAKETGMTGYKSKVVKYLLFGGREK